MNYSSLRPDYEISRIISGNWQLAGGHGKVDVAEAIENLHRLAELGITTFDCADIYTGVEEILGIFLKQYEKRHGKTARDRLGVHTKFVPDLDTLATLTPSEVRYSIQRSCRRLGVEALDLVQFHWWDFAIPGYVEAAQALQTLQAEGLVKNIGLTNFDSAHLVEIVQAGVPVISNQVQYSLLDRRPAFGLAEVAEKQGVSLLCYGAISGGFLTGSWLHKEIRPDRDRSETKYRLIIEEFGDWELYQELLETLNGVAAEHGVSIASVALAWVLSQKGVAAVICSMRSVKHAQDNIEALGVQLTPGQKQSIAAVIAKSPWQSGDVYDLERDRSGKHGKIMKYNLSHE